MSTSFLELNAVQSPFDMRSVDAQNRVMFSCNYLAKVISSSATLEECIIKLIVDAGLAVSGTSLFSGSNVSLPTGPGPITTILRTGGFGPEQTHNGNINQRPGVQIITRALSYTVARDKAEAIYTLLNGKHNFTVAA